MSKGNFCVSTFLQILAFSIKENFFSLRTKLETKIYIVPRTHIYQLICQDIKNKEPNIPVSPLLHKCSWKVDNSDKISDILFYNINVELLGSFKYLN